MTAVAGALSKIASVLGDLAAVAPNIMTDDAFTGPGRSEHDQAFRDASLNAKTAADTLTAEAKSLERGAIELDRAQKLWDRQEQARKTDAAERARALSAKHQAQR